MKKKKIDMKDINKLLNGSPNVTLHMTVPDGGEESQLNEVVLDLMNGTVSVRSTTVDLENVVKIVERMTKKMQGPDIMKYVS